MTDSSIADAYAGEKVVELVKTLTAIQEFRDRLYDALLDDVKNLIEL